MILTAFAVLWRAYSHYWPESGMPNAPDELPVVHIVDDDAEMRSGLESLLRSVGLDARTYGSPPEFLKSDGLEFPGCIVLDIRLPGTSGLDFQEGLAGFGIHLPVILMTGHGDIPMSVRAMKAGAVDFLSKPFRDQDMIDAVTAAISRDRVRRASEAQAMAIVDRYATLSPREREVMALVTAGKMNKQIAGELGLSEVTVKIHRGAAMRKMAARSLADLVRMADTLNNRTR
jgi:FixJ family two-component response regulator